MIIWGVIGHCVLWGPGGETNRPCHSLDNLFVNISRAKRRLSPHSRWAPRTVVLLGIILLRRIKPTVSNFQGLPSIRACQQAENLLMASWFIPGSPPTFPWWGKNWWAIDSAIVWPKTFHHSTTSLTVLMPQEYELEITFPAERISSPSDRVLAGKC